MLFYDKRNVSNNLNIVRKKMNEDMETKIIYETYRRTVCLIMESKKEGFLILNFENAFIDFNKPHVLDEFTDFNKPHVLDEFTIEQTEMIKQMKIELYELGKLFGYLI